MKVRLAPSMLVLGGMTSLLVLVAGALSAQQQVSRQQLREVRDACKADMQALCGDVTPGNGALMSCLEANADNVSSGCTAKLEELKAMQ